MLSVQPGYPDYARMSLASGFTLSYTNQAFNVNTTLFQGYIGSWPYINHFWDGQAGTDFYQIQIIFSSDSSFSNDVGFYTLYRYSSSTCFKQYKCLSDWVTIQINPITLSNTNVAGITFFGTTGMIVSNDVGSLDVASLEVSNATVNAGATLTFQPFNIFPGKNRLSWLSSQNTGWFLTVSRLDVSNTFKPIYFSRDIKHGFGADTDIWAPDAPLQVTFRNSTASASTVYMYLGWYP